MTFTRDTIQNFIDARDNFWTEPGTLLAADDDFFLAENAQVEKGQRRLDVAVIDFGTVRVVV